MPYLYTTQINEDECIGDSLDEKINPNFLSLDNAVQGLSGTIDSFKTGGDLFLKNSTQSARMSVRKGSNSEGYNIVIGNGGQNTVGEVGATYKGSHNTGLGWSALLLNTTGYQNTGIGQAALYYNTTGYANTAVGNGALVLNTTGYSNTAVGNAGLYFNTTGFFNSSIGHAALYYNTQGNANTAVGVVALYNNTTGNFNTACGYYALFSNTTKTGSTAVGSQALYSSIADNNTAVGTNALYATTTGIENIAIGVSAGWAGSVNANTTGSNNIFIGVNSVGTSPTTSNHITLGNSNHLQLRCAVNTITSISDRRDKTNIETIPAGLDFINKLKPVSFVWNMRDGGKKGIPEFGFIAQDLQETQKETGVTVPNLVLEDNPEKLEASPATLIPVLVKAIQELSAELKELKQQLQK